MAFTLTTAQADTIDDFVREKMKSKAIPGVALTVLKDGKIVKSQGYGMANLELSAPVTEKTAFQLASVTKQFTATAIMALVEDGKLHLEDKIVSLLPDLPAAWSGVTLRQLLNHTSGIKSYTNIEGFDKTLRKDFTPQEIIALVSKEPMEFAPGEKWNYNNSGYFLLGMILEKVTGKSYNDFLTERIFKPLGMNDTRVNNLSEIIPNRAQGYSRSGDHYVNGEYLSPTQPFAAGALISTIADLARWDKALDGETILKSASLTQMWTPTALPDHQEQGYGFGWVVGVKNHHRRISHGGGIPGFSTETLRLPDDKLSVIVLTNRDGGDAGAIALGVADILVPGVIEKPAPAIPDSDPALTKKLRDMVTNAAQGKFDPESFTPEAGKALIPRLKDSAAMIKGWGELTAFDLIEDALRTRRYRATFTQETVSLFFTLTKEGKIAGIRLIPGE